jgi:UDP-N-acetylmuramate--alanine ligase
VDEPGGAALAARTGARTVGERAGADWRMDDVVATGAGTRLTVVRDGVALGELRLAVPGVHNARNALAATAMALELGAPFAAAVRALGRYAGVARRWQYRGTAHGVTFVDDYAHLPSEVAAAVDTARRGEWRRVVVVFQPHRYSRTASLWPAFADVFVGSDLVVVTEVYAAGEAPRPGITGKLIVDAVLDAHPSTRLAWLPARRDLVAYLVRTLRPGDLCLTLDAGDLTSLPDEVIDALASTG